MAYTAQQVIQGMRNDPQKLLRKVYIMIAGGDSTTPHGISTFRVEVQDWKKVSGFTTGFSGWRGKTKDREFVRINKLSGAAKPDTGLGLDEFNAHYVGMRQIGDALTTTHTTLPTVGLPDLMITSKLSGCHFAVGLAASGALTVTHIHPDNNITDLGQRAQALKTAVDAGFAQVNGQFRKRQEYGETANIIGRLHNNQWEFYCQKTDYGQGHTFQISGTSKI